MVVFCRRLYVTTCSVLQVTYDTVYSHIVSKQDNTFCSLVASPWPLDFENALSKRIIQHSEMKNCKFLW